MYEITRKIGLDAGHRVPFHESKCRALHGHRYTVEATARAGQTIDYMAADLRVGKSGAGMLVDFGDLKRVLMEKVHDRFDHTLMLWDGDPLLDTDLLQIVNEKCGLATLQVVPCIPTAEELAAFWYGLVQEGLNELAEDRTAPGLVLVELAVWETPNNVARFSHRPSTPETREPHEELLDEQWIGQ